MAIVITVHLSEHADEHDAAEYLRYIAGQVEEDFTSGHVDRDTHWSSEGLMT